MEDVTKAVSELKSVVQAEIKEVETKATKAAEEVVKSAIAPIEETLNTVKGIAEKQQEQLDNISTQIAKNKVERVKTTHSHFAEVLKENKDKLIALMNGKREGGFQIEVKDFVLKEVGDMSIADNVTGEVPQAERIAGLNTIASRQVRLLGLAQTRTTTSNVVSWTYQQGKEGAAGVTEEGATKNQIDFNILVGSNKVEKVTAYIKVTDEMLEDIEFMASEINNELTRELLKAVENEAFRGDGTTPNLQGLLEVATTFAAGAAAGTVANPNLIDVIDAAATQILVAHQSAPNYVMLNPYDCLKLRTTKVDNTDRNDYAYRAGLVVERGQMFIAGIPVVETPLVNAGEFVVGDFTKFNIAQKKGLTIEVGLDGNDFTKNFKTIRAEWRGVAYVKHNDRTAFVTGDIDTAIAALAST